MAMNKEDILEAISNMTVLEIVDLISAMEEKFGVSAAAATVAVAAGPAAAAAVVEEVEEKTEFDVVIKAAGPKKIEVIKVIRQLTSLGLVEAKNMAETADAKVLEAVGKDVANDAAAKLKEAGAEVVVL